LIENDLESSQVDVLDIKAQGDAVNYFKGIAFFRLSCFDKAYSQFMDLTNSKARAVQEASLLMAARITFHSSHIGSDAVKLRRPTGRCEPQAIKLTPLDAANQLRQIKSKVRTPGFRSDIDQYLGKMSSF
jgi:hypothetical protein